MLVSIDIPDRIFTKLEGRAREERSTVEDIALEAIRRELENGDGTRVKLPLIRSAHPGSLRSMTNAEIDEVLAD